MNNNDNNNNNNHKHNCLCEVKRKRWNWLTKKDDDPDSITNPIPNIGDNLINSDSDKNSNDSKNSDKNSDSDDSNDEPKYLYYFPRVMMRNIVFGRYHWYGFKNCETDLWWKAGYEIVDTCDVHPGGWTVLPADIREEKRQLM